MLEDAMGMFCLITNSGAMHLTSAAGELVSHDDVKELEDPFGAKTPTREESPMLGPVSEYCRSHRVIQWLIR